MLNTIKNILLNERGAIGVVQKESTIALEVEVTEGTVVATAGTTSYIEALSDNLEFSKTREELSRDTLGGTVEAEETRVGIPEVVGSLGVEFRASTTAGTAPQSADKLLRSALGGKRTAATDTTTTGNSSTVLEFGGAHSFLVGDSVLVKEAGAYEIRPISAAGATDITFPFALDNGAPSDGVAVEAVTTYYHDTANSVTLSAEHNVGGELVQTIGGLRVGSMSLENFTVGQIANLNFSMQGLSLERADGAPSFSPDFTADALPPVALEACLWLNGSKKSYTELSLSVENTISTIMDSCSADGKVGSRITEQVISISCNPYSDDTTLTEWDDFNANTDTSVFFYTFNPSTTAGEFSEAIAVWLPQCKITAAPFADNDGIITDALEMKAFRSSAANDTIFISYN